jgi:hypothetical protein
MMWRPSSSVSKASFVTAGAISMKLGVRIPLGILFRVFVILCLCNSLKINLHFWKGCNRKPFKYFHIHGFYFRDHDTHAKIKPTRK